MANRYPELTPSEIQAANQRAQANRVNDFAIQEAQKQKCITELLQDEADMEAMMQANETRVTLREDTFRENFLPFIDGTISKRLPPGMTEEQIRAEATRAWWGLAGGAHNEVDVVDYSGKVCFTVPPTSETNLLHMDSSKNELQAVNQYQMEKRAGMPQYADQILQAGLQRKLDHLLSKSVDHQETIKKVDKMYEFYNLTPPSKELKLANSSSQNYPTDEFDM